MNQQIEPDPEVGSGPAREGLTTHRTLRDQTVLVVAAAAMLFAGAFVLAGCDADPVEEVDVADVTEDGPASAPPEDQTVSLSGDVVEVLTESALTVADAQSEEPLLVLLSNATMVNGSTAAFGGQPALAQFIPPEATLQLLGTIETFDSVEMAERLGIVLNDELFAPWEGEPVFIAQQVDTFDADADADAQDDDDAAADTDPESE